MKPANRTRAGRDRRVALRSKPRAIRARRARRPMHAVLGAAATGTRPQPPPNLTTHPTNVERATMPAIRGHFGSAFGVRHPQRVDDRRAAGRHGIGVCTRPIRRPRIGPATSLRWPRLAGVRRIYPLLIRRRHGSGRVPAALGQADGSQTAGATKLDATGRSWKQVSRTVEGRFCLVPMQPSGGGVRVVASCHRRDPAGQGQAHDVQKATSQPCQGSAAIRPAATTRFPGRPTGCAHRSSRRGRTVRLRLTSSPGITRVSGREHRQRPG